MVTIERKLQIHVLSLLKLLQHHKFSQNISRFGLCRLNDLKTQGFSIELVSSKETENKAWNVVS